MGFQQKFWQSWCRDAEFEPVQNRQVSHSACHLGRHLLVLSPGAQ